jgi:bifunctional ADP-heptose synthase (sugar kinase/adenylyltransferase)
LICRPERPPEELDRLDIKNWSLTPPNLSAKLVEALVDVVSDVDGILVMDQAGADGTGVVTGEVEEALSELGARRSDLLILADSRSAVRPFAHAGLKMNGGEFARRTGNEPALKSVSALADGHGRPVYVTLADQGILGASPGCEAEHVPARPVRGETDIVGAGDAVLANLGAALASGATPREAMHLSMAAASIVIHQLGTTGTANAAELIKAFA